MEININENSRLCDIQKAFSHQFPFLKIGFFVFKPGQENVFRPEFLISDTTKKLGEITHSLRQGKISIHGHQKVRTLEQHFYDYFGVNIQVFRKSGNNWLQTIVTDDWSLSDQNRMGEEWIALETEEPIENFDPLGEEQ